MDLGIANRKAIVCAASKGLGFACAMALAREGVRVIITGRDTASLETAAAKIRSATGASVHAAPGDITTQEGRSAALSLCPDPDILINNAGGPPPGDFRDFTETMW
jgi:3-oxoacyl-[acyl-carrier protein] reductase